MKFRFIFALAPTVFGSSSTVRCMRANLFDILHVFDLLTFYLCISPTKSRRVQTLFMDWDVTSPQIEYQAGSEAFLADWNAGGAGVP